MSRSIITKKNILHNNINYHKIKGVFAGSGSDALNNPEICERVIQLTNKKAEDINLLYIGTATYDSEQAMTKQTICFQDSGVNIIPFECTLKTPTENEIIDVTSKADIILVSGGNTLYACDRWKSLNLQAHLASAAIRGCVLTGGSAGAICWFTAGHSDSMDPQTYRKDNIPESDKGDTTWEYIRVPCLNFIPGLCCPHYDKIQSNNIHRAIDFENMMRRHSNERGICIDHWASIVIPGDGTFEIFSPKDKVGSVNLETKTFDQDRNGVPGVWIKDVVNKEDVKTELIGTHGAKGSIEYLFRGTIDNSDVIEDPRINKARSANSITF